MDSDTQMREFVACARDFGYWLREYVWIEDKVQGDKVRFELWDSQKRILPEFLESVYIFILKARQLGLTWLTAAYCLWKAIYNQNHLVWVISEKEEKAISFLNRVKFMFDKLPHWMKPRVLQRTTQKLHFGYEEKDKSGNVVIEGLNSLIYSSTTTPTGAQSETPNILVLDEASLIENIRKIWRSSKPGIDAAQGKIIVISNPIKDGVGWPWFREWYIKAWRGLAGRIKYIFMPWWDHPERDTKKVPDPADPSKMIGAFIAQQKLEGYDDDDISMHYPSSIEEAIEAMTGSYFGSVLNRHREFRKGRTGYLEELDSGIVFQETRRGGILTVWEDPDGQDWQGRYCIFSDVSEGLGQTSSVAYVFDRIERRFVARLKSNKIDADQWAFELIKLGKWCGDFPYICPELSGAGQTTVKTLRKQKYPKIFRNVRLGRSRNRQTPDYGLPQTDKNKSLIAAALKSYLRDASENSMPDSELIDECSTFIRHPGGRLGKEDDRKFDDCVIAAGGTLYIDEIVSQPHRIRKTKKKQVYVPTTWRERIGIDQEHRNPWLE